ncbi:hypothetical protein [Actinoplanes aureus]|uniref:hypothetical protein n=1 Tax=Actinoplanes aureus TaxID=2792083 RepID=UPI002814AA47|nr:hypothetical protein [Actinoplanes aureus]
MRLFDRQPLLIAAGWIFAVVLAVLVGVVGIGLVGADLTARQGAPVSEAQVERELEGLGTAPPSSSSPSPSPSSSRGPATGRSFPTRGGTVVADCERILSMAPAQGFAVHEQDDDEGEFRSVDNPKDRVDVDLTCVDGVPELRVQTED